MRKVKNKKVLVAISLKQSFQNATGQAGSWRKKKKVMVAMSGGVDSSVAAALLKKAGFDVVGVFMKCWTEDLEKRCRNLTDDEYTARRVAVKLGIPFYKFDFTREYKKKVIDYFVKEYAKGKTPNPDVMCNKEIKFGLFYDKAISLGFDFVATGHYTQVRKGRFGINLFCGKDPTKDQSYFLYRVASERFKKVIFPVGKYYKTKVRKIAKALDLPNAARKDSQGICFVGKVKLDDFLKNYIQEKPGKIVTKDGEIIGEHQGVYFYTIGQRKGIRLPGGPFYVLDKNVKENLLIVTRNEKDLYKKELLAENINWLSAREPKLPLRIKAQIRYRQKAMPATIEPFSHKTIKIIFDNFQRAISPGQSAVFYRGKKLLGGGIIKN